MSGRWFAELFEVAAEQNGFIAHADVLDLGGTRQVLVDMCRAGHVERVGRGLYRFVLFPRGPFDELRQATLWPRGLGVISHDSALGLWELCDVNPARIHLTVPRRERIRREVPKLYFVHSRDLDEQDVTVVEGIPVVTAHRAIIDGMERHLDRRLIGQAIDSARRRGLVQPELLGALTVRS